MNICHSGALCSTTLAFLCAGILIRLKIPFRSKENTASGASPTSCTHNKTAKLELLSFPWLHCSRFGNPWQGLQRIYHRELGQPGLDLEVVEANW